MSNTINSPYTSFFRRRAIGRASSPPTWACYEQIPYDDEGEDYSDSPSEDESCSEDEEDYGRAATHEHDSEISRAIHMSEGQDDTQNMEIDEVDDALAEKQAAAAADSKRDVKGKQRAMDPDPGHSEKRQRRRQRRPVYTLRPILTIQKSQGFVWNQDLFVPPYIKDRYVASTSPPNSNGFISNSWSSTRSSITDYEVEVVEIRVSEGDLDDIIP